MGQAAPALGPVIVKKCSCGRQFTDSEWAALKHIGDQHLPADETGPEMNLEYRNCPCGSTMAVDHGPRS